MKLLSVICLAALLCGCTRVEPPAVEARSCDCGWKRVAAEKPRSTERDWIPNTWFLLWERYDQGTYKIRPIKDNLFSVEKAEWFMGERSWNMNIVDGGRDYFVLVGNDNKTQWALIRTKQGKNEFIVARIRD